MDSEDKKIWRVHAELDNECRAFLRCILLKYRDPAWCKFAADRMWRIVLETIDQRPGKPEPFHVRREEEEEED